MSEKILGDAAAVENAEPVASDAASHAAPTFAPGRWLVDDDRKYHAQHYTPVYSDDERLSRIGANQIAWVVSEKANAHMIAAAPELYEALIYLRAEARALLFARDEIREIVGNTNIACIERRLAQADAALAKAEGKQ